MIEKLLNEPESATLEFKEEIPKPDDLAKLLVAFSNTKGGKIIIGVSDKKREIIGLDQKFNIEEYVMNIASNNCSVNNIGEKQRTRNPLIARLLFEMGYFDEWGQGIDRMISSMREAGLEDPAFVEEALTFRVILRNRKSQKSSQKIIDLIRDNPHITIEGLSKNTGITERAVKKNLAILKKKQTLKRIGSDRAGHWEVYER